MHFNFCKTAKDHQVPTPKHSHNTNDSPLSCVVGIIGTREECVEQISTLLCDTDTKVYWFTGMKFLVPETLDADLATKRPELGRIDYKKRFVILPLSALDSKSPHIKAIRDEITCLCTP